MLKQKEDLRKLLNLIEIPFFVKDEIIRLTWSKEEIDDYVCEEMFKYIEEHPEKQWNWHYMSYNPNLTIKYMEEHPEKPWNWEGISQNPNITMKYVEDHPEKEWNWGYISRNSCITMKDIEEHPEKPWDWYEISKNLFVSYKKELIQNLSESKLL